MDFGTMSHKVNKGKYRSLEDFAVRPSTFPFVALCVSRTSILPLQNDFKLVTSNAKLFNPPGTIYHIEADRIQVQEAWGLDHIAKVSGTVIQYETDWNIEIEREDEDEMDEKENDDDGMDVDERDRSVSVLSQQQNQAGLSGRRGPRGLHKKPGQGTASTGISEALEPDGGLPGSKDGLGAFPPGSDWAKTMLALKLKSTIYSSLPQSMSNPFSRKTI
jgi:bromodomain-containing protein 7